MMMIDDDERHNRDFTSYLRLVRAKQYDILVNHLNTTLFNTLPYISFPPLIVMQILLTLATLSPHYHQFPTSFNDEELSSIGVRSMDVLQSLLYLATTTTTTNNDNTIFAQPQPCPKDRDLLIAELLKLLNAFQGDNSSEIKFTSSLPARKDQHSDEDDSENSQEELSPLKLQLNLLLNDPSQDTNPTVKRKLEFETGPSKRMVNDDSVFGNTLLLKQVNLDFWKLLRWGFKNASSAASDLKSQHIWQVWKPIIGFIVELLILQFDHIFGDLDKQSDNHIKRLLLKDTFISHILKQCSYDDKTSLYEFVNRIFFNTKTMNADYVGAIYLQELKKNHRFILTKQIDEISDEYYQNYIKLGLTSVVIRKNLAYLAYRLILVRYLSCRDSNFHNALKNSREFLLDSFFNNLLTHLIKLSYLELREFFVEDANTTLKNYKMEFLSQVCTRLLTHYSNSVPDDGDDDGVDILYDDSLQRLSSLQLNSDPFNYIKTLDITEQTFTNFYNVYIKITLLISVLFEMWFKLNKIETSDNWNLFLDLLDKGDNIRHSILQKEFELAKVEARLTPLEMTNFNNANFELVKLKDVFSWKFASQNSNHDIVEDSQ